jgi:S1-C subfamily serine protease
MLGVRAWANSVGGVVVAACVLFAAAADAQPASGPLKFESHPTDTTYRTLMQGSGFWVDDTGDLVTARHVVEGCSQVVISGQGLSQTAKVVALSGTDDVALIHAPHTSTLAVVFSADATDDAGLPVLAASFEALKTLKSSGIFSNGMVQAQDVAGGTLQLTLQAERAPAGRRCWTAGA